MKVILAALAIVGVAFASMMCGAMLIVTAYNLGLIYL